MVPLYVPKQVPRCGKSLIPFSSLHKYVFDVKKMRYIYIHGGIFMNYFNGKIILAPSKELAEEYASDITASVEAEYGDFVVPGRIVTLAHHGPRATSPAPCIAQQLPKISSGTILVSHVDLDTLGGIMALIGIKPIAPEFWQGAAFIDVMGPHHIYELSQGVQDLLNAYYAFNETNRSERITTIADITEAIEPQIAAITCLLGEDSPQKTEMLRKGVEWRERVTQAVEDCLIDESQNVRVFRTHRVFCASSYYSPKLGAIAKATVVLNEKFRAITVAFEDGGKAFSAKTIVQSLWGEEAGGRDGIAGSPRNWERTDTELEEELKRAAKAVNELF